MRIYVMRHGTTVWNEKFIIQGRSNNRLSSNGKILVEEAAKKYNNVKFDIIFSSPLMRTMQTANIMNKYHNVKVVKDDRLIEVDQGIFTRREKSSLTHEENMLRKSKDESYGMEKFENVYLRTKNFIDDLKANYKYKNVLVVTHNVNASYINCIFKCIKTNFDNREHSHCFNNAEIRCYEI